MGRKCSPYGEKERCMQGLVRKPEERDHLEDLGVD
jgi:hypothetical protein